MDVTLRSLGSSDLPLMLAWAWIPQIWEYMPTSRKGENLKWEDHWTWFRKGAYFGNRLDWMITVQERGVGVIHATLDTEYPEIGLYIGEVSLWGQGVGKRALEIVMGKLSTFGHKTTQAVIHPRNKRSIKLFTSLGFKEVGGARNGQRLYRYTLGGPEISIPIYEAQNRRSYQPVPA